MINKRIILPYPTPGQQKVLSTAERFNWLAAGRRWRKTTLAMSIAVTSAVEGQKIIWGSPSHSQSSIGWRETKKAAGTVATFNVQKRDAIFPGGGTIFFRSLDHADTARGLTADGVVIDEAGFVHETAWYEVLRPTMMDNPDSWAWILGTPNGRNWFWKEHTAAVGRRFSNSWSIPSLGCYVDDDGILHRKHHPLENPDLPWDEIQQIFDTTPLSIFRQEILAVFLENEGAVFRRIAGAMKAPLVFNWNDHTDEDGRRHYMVAGIDWGKQDDFTAISVGCVNCRKEVYRDRFNQIDYTFQRGRIENIFGEFGIEYGLAESNSIGTPILEELQRSNLSVYPFETTTASKPPLIENLSLSIERADWQFQSDPIWTSELEAYERKVSPVTHRPTYSAPAGQHDDTVMARALMVRAAEDGGPLILFGV